MRKVLIVDDSRLNRILAKKILVHAEFQVIEAENGKEAIEHALSQTPDLILMDLSMPILDGWSTLDILRSTPQSKNIPVVALTAHAMEGDKEKALEAGFDDYITKPIDVSLFASQVETHVSYYKYTKIS